MRLLLDTHVFLRYITAGSRLPAPFLGAVRDPTNEVYLSVASVWEAVIKHGLGKLHLPAPPAEYLAQQWDDVDSADAGGADASLPQGLPLPRVGADTGPLTSTSLTRSKSTMLNLSSSWWTMTVLPDAECDRNSLWGTAGPAHRPCG